MWYGQSLRRFFGVSFLEVYSPGVWRLIKDFWGQKWHSVEVGLLYLIP